MQGRKPTTPEARQKRGDVRRGRDVPLTIAGREVPPMPPGFTAPMKRLWELVCEDLATAGVIDRADWAIIEAFVVVVTRARQARGILRKSGLAGTDGLLATNSQGVVANPALLIEERAWKEVRQLSEQLPLSPWGRARLNLHATGGAGGAVDEVDRVLGPARPRLVASNE